MKQYKVTRVGFMNWWNENLTPEEISYYFDPKQKWGELENRCTELGEKNLHNVCDVVGTKIFDNDFFRDVYQPSIAFNETIKNLPARKD